MPISKPSRGFSGGLIAALILPALAPPAPHDVAVIPHHHEHAAHENHEPSPIRQYFARPVTGDVTVALTGVQATGSVGNLTPSTTI